MEIYTIKKTKMKRERLFKAKRVDNGEWVFGYLIKKQLHNKFDSPPSLMYEKWFIDKGSDINLFDGIFHQVEVHPETVCSFVRRQDKNGNNIFEGDMVKASHPNIGSVEGCVVYNNDLCRYEVKFSDSHLNWSFYDIDEIEIIGNIHD